MFLFFLFFIAVDENDTHASATHTTSGNNRASVRVSQARMCAKIGAINGRSSTSLCSQRIVIGSEELAGTSDSIDSLVRRKIDEFDKTPRIIRSTALIIKTSRAPARKSVRRANGIGSTTTTSYVGSTPMRGPSNDDSRTTTAVSISDNGNAHDRRHQVSSEDTTDRCSRATTNGSIAPSGTNIPEVRCTLANGYTPSLVSRIPDVTSVSAGNEKSAGLRNGAVDRRKRLQSSAGKRYRCVSIARLLFFLSFLLPLFLSFRSVFIDSLSGTKSKGLRDLFTG